MANSGTTELHPAQSAEPTSRLDEAEPARPPDPLSALLEQLARGDRTALRALYDLTVPTLLAYVRTVLPNYSDAEEVICDVYTQVWQSASRYQASRATVMTWLLMICRARAIDRYRGEQARAHETVVPDRPSSPPVDSDPGPDAWLDSLQRGSAVRAAIESLTPVRRHLLGLAFFHGMSHEEIARTNELALGTVKSHIRRALSALRKRLKDTGQG